MMPAEAENQSATAPFQRHLDSAPAAPRRMVVCVSNGQFHSQVDPSDIDELIGQKDTFLWLDLQNPRSTISSCCVRSSSFTGWRSKTRPATTSGPSSRR